MLRPMAPQSSDSQQPAENTSPTRDRESTAGTKRKNDEEHVQPNSRSSGPSTTTTEARGYRGINNDPKVSFYELHNLVHGLRLQILGSEITSDNVKEVWGNLTGPEHDLNKFLKYREKKSLSNDSFTHEIDENEFKGVAEARAKLGKIKLWIVRFNNEISTLFASGSSDDAKTRSSILSSENVSLFHFSSDKCLPKF
jgi:hypothetical protein